jgi:hypothetical protein
LNQGPLLQLHGIFACEVHPDRLQVGDGLEEAENLALFQEVEVLLLLFRGC